MHDAGEQPPQPAFPSGSQDQREEQILTLKLEGEIFATEIMRVREVLDMAVITPVPNAPAFSPGVVNVRGIVVPIIDLRCRLQMNEGERAEDSRVIVVEVSVQGERTTVGLIADSVHDVIGVDSARIEPIPRIGTRWHPDYIRGVVQHDGKFVILLDLDRIASQWPAEDHASLAPTGMQRGSHAFHD